MTDQRPLSIDEARRLTAEDPGTPDARAPLSLDEARDYAPVPGVIMPTPSSAVELYGEGAQRAVADAIGALPWLATQATNAVGLTELDPNVYSDAVKRGMEWVEGVGSRVLGNEPRTERPTPEGRIEESIYGAGYGGGAGASIIGGANLLRLAMGVLGRGGGPTAAIAGQLSAQPGAQIAADSVGSGVAIHEDNPYLGLAAAMTTGALPNLGRRVVTPFPRSGPRTAMTPPQAEAIDTALDRGYQLTAGQLTQSRPIQTLEGVLEYAPAGGVARDAITSADNRLFAQEVLSGAGIQGDTLTPQSLRQGFTDVGAMFDDVARRGELTIDRQFLGDVQALQARIGMDLPPDQQRIVQQYINSIMTQVQQATQAGAQRVLVAGDRFQRVYSRLRARARTASDPELQRSLNELANIFDATFVRTVGDPALADMWQSAKRQYRNLLVLERTYAQGRQGDRFVGDISIGAFERAIRAVDQTGFTRGGSSYDDLLDVGRVLRSADVPDSGTPGRMLWQQMLTGAGLGSGGAGAGLASGVDPLAATGAALATPVAAGYAVNNPITRAYLGNQLLTGSTPVPRAGILAEWMAQQAGGGATPN